ncbi:MAG: hypothetical protein JRI74_07085 [Deltaproteobacteria bacterium]|nr:hypothetical protein [Deltaproteobacteria bacterium]
MKTFTWLLMLTFFLVPVTLLAQTDDQMQLIRDAAKVNKKLIVSENVNLTEEEAKNFWPVYEEYQKALSTLNERTGKAIKSYAENYNALSDEAAKSLLDEILTIQEDRLKLQRSYMPNFDKVLPTKKVVRYYQVENKLNAIIRYELARGIPLVK